MGSDLSMTPPTKPHWRLVTADSYAALYRRETDHVYQAEQVDYWHRVYLTSDDQEMAANAMGVVLSIFAQGRFKRLERDDLCRPAADEPFAESYPRDVLEDDNPLYQRRAELMRELNDVERQINERGTQ